MWLDIITSVFASFGNEIAEIVKEQSVNTRFLGMPIWDGEDFGKLMFRLSINTTILLVIVRLIYYSKERRKDFLFAYLSIGTTVFLLCFVLENVNLDLAFALGLFAIFGIIRFRTASIPIKEMSYLFIIIGISVMNALANKKVSYAELIAANAIVILIAFGLERIWLLKHETNKMVIYERIELIQKGREEELMADLKKRTGIDIRRYDLEKIDFMRDTVNIRIFFFSEGNSFSDRSISENSSDD